MYRAAHNNNYNNNNNYCTSHVDCFLPRLAVLKCIYFIENLKMIEIRDFLFKYETVVINLIFHFLLENVLQFDY